MVALPLFPLGTVLLPGGELPLNLFEPRYLELLRRLVALPPAERVFGVIALRQGNEVGPDAPLDLHEIGCAARLVAVDGVVPAIGGVRVEAVGSRRFRLRHIDIDAGTPFHTGAVDWLDEPVGDEPEPWAERVRRDVAAYRARLGARPADLPPEPLPLSYAAADAVVLDTVERQRVLAADSVQARLRFLAGVLRRELTLLDELPSLPRTTPSTGPSLN